MRTSVGVVVVATLLLSAPAAAQLGGCRNYAQKMQLTMKGNVTALRMIEREASDRTIGLDTRPFDYLLGEARKVAAIIGERSGLLEEEDLQRCRNHIPPIRRICAEAAQALIGIIGEQMTGGSIEGAKRSYSQAMPECERWMGLAPLQTAFRSAGL